MSSLRGDASRRHVIRLLGGGASGSLAAIAALAGAEAKKKKKKRKKTKGKTCSPGTRMASIDVPADGNRAFTPVLKDGQRFRLLAVGSWSTNDAHANDAYAAYKKLSRFDPILEFEGVRLGLSVDDGSPDEWGDYNPNHVYELEMTGRGDALSLHYTDPQPADNSGTLLVEVYCE
jgi:hypothetical protein